MPNRDEPLHDRQIVVMGVMGAGKTTIGQALAGRLDCPFIDADDLHPEVNRRKLASSVALTDLDREPWIEQIAALIRQLHERGETAVIACSALTRSVRATLTAASDGVVFVHLQGPPAAIRQRLAARKDHFADPTLLASQYATLEAPAEAILADASGTPEEIVEGIVFALHG
ncbi:MAG TPA: gluconokinase, GntK/IdnK-type [Thermoanaerobaculia bacterium]|nr:gluconokinase, GntK/IdnK-type [Thermoanaerobaculia bacterium]